MRTKDSRTALLVIGIAALMLLGTNPAEAADNSMIVRGTNVQFMPDIDYLTANDDGDPVQVSSDDDLGWAIGFEFLATPKLGIAFQYLEADPDFTINVDGSPDYVVSTQSTLGVKVYSASLNLHLTADRVVDVYVSPIVAYMSFDDLDFRVELPDNTVETLHLDVKSDLAWGVGIGIDVPLGGSGWLATASLNYLDSSLDVSEADDPDMETLGFDPLVISAGFGYRF